MRQKITLFIIAVFLSSAMSFAQNLSFIDRDGYVIENNSIVTFNQWADDNIHMYAAVDLKNNTDKNITFDFDVTVLEIQGANGIDVCGFGSCVPVSDTRKFSGTVEGAGIYDFDTYILSFMLPDADNFHIKIEFKVTAGSEEHIVYIILTSKQTNITDVSVRESVYVSQYGNLVSLNFNFATDAKRVLNVYDITGRKIKEMVLPSHTGITPLPSAPKGVYLYSITENGSITKSGKYVIR